MSGNKQMHLKQTLSIIISVIVLIHCIACSTASTPSDPSTEQPSSPESLFELYKDDPLLFDAEAYAEHHGITVNEAIRRLELQDAAGNLDAELSVKEAETFGGLWIEHTPEFKVVVLFTEDGGETIAPYLQDELAGIIEVRTVSRSLIELQQAQIQASNSIRELGILTESEIDVYTNSVKIYVVDRAKLDDALQSGKLELPDYIEVITVESFGMPE